MDKLYKVLKEIVRFLADAISFSITVGMTANVTINFKKP